MRIKSRNKKVQAATQTAYMKFLCDLRNAITSEYSKVLQKEKRAIVLGYD